MLMMVGALRIEIAPFNVHQVSETGDTEYAIKPVVGAEPLLEYVGEGGNQLNLSGRLFPHELGGIDELELLRQLRVSGKPQYVMRGDGRPYGWYAILNVQEQSSYLNSHGVGKLIEVSISLRRAQMPSPLSFYSLMQGLF